MTNFQNNLNIHNKISENLHPCNSRYSQAIGLLRASKIAWTKKKKTDAKRFKICRREGLPIWYFRGGNRILQAKYGRKSQNNLEAKHCYYFGEATKFEYFWDISKSRIYLRPFWKPGKCFKNLALPK